MMGAFLTSMRFVFLPAGVIVCAWISLAGHQSSCKRQGCLLCSQFKILFSSWIHSNGFTLKIFDLKSNLYSASWWLNNRNSSNRATADSETPSKFHTKQKNNLEIKAILLNGEGQGINFSVRGKILISVSPTVIIYF